MGISAQQLGLSPTLYLTAVGLALGPLAGMRYKFQAIDPEELTPAGDWPQPLLVGDEPVEGPIMVSIEFWARPGLEDQLLAAIEGARFARRRTGASSWQVWRDAEHPGRYTEQFVVASWQEHLRQHERVTKHDQQRLEAVRALSDPDRPATVTHWLTPPPAPEKPIKPV